MLYISYIQYTLHQHYYIQAARSKRKALRLLVEIRKICLAVGRSVGFSFHARALHHQSPTRRSKSCALLHAACTLIHDLDITT